jgi:hypothetical protein|uniref:DUF2069 domain-containing protein n=1 Tax=Desulfomonile tiedjei TaxID=2358 RepID=A0A7C4AQK2_9BACT
MSINVLSGLSHKLFPPRRFESDFPLAVWFAGLWLYLKSFLYVCFLYMIGLDPPPYPAEVQVEIAYFAIALIPTFVLAWSLWNEKKWGLTPAIVFLVIDTPFLLMHVLRLGQEGFLDSGLTRMLEFGGLVLNVVCLAWLLGSRSAAKQARPRE